MRRVYLSEEQSISIQTRYEQGTKIQDLAAQFSCDHKTIRKALKARGVIIRNRQYCAHKPDAETLRREYLDERQSSPTLAKKYGVGYGCICTWLKEYGIPIRSFSEAKKLDMERWSYEDRLRMSEASRAIFTGRPRSHKDRCTRAKGVEQKAKLSKYEALLLTALQAKGLNPIPQMAVDKFNIDFAFPEQLLAIELHGGCWHNTPKKKFFDEAKRACIEPMGWRILVIRARRKDWVNVAVERILDALNTLPLLVYKL